MCTWRSPIGVRVDLRIFGPQITRYGRDTLLNIEHLVGSNKNDVLGGNSKANSLLGRKGRPEEIAAMVRALCGPAGRYVTGQTVCVNGGMYLT